MTLLPSGPICPDMVIKQGADGESVLYWRDHSSALTVSISSEALFNKTLNHFQLTHC